MLSFKNKKNTAKKNKQDFSVVWKILVVLLLVFAVGWGVCSSVWYGKLQEKSSAAHGKISKACQNVSDRVQDIEQVLTQKSAVRLYDWRNTIYRVTSDTNEITVSTNAVYSTYYTSVTTCVSGDTYYYTGTQYNCANQYCVMVVDETGNVLMKALGSQKDETAKTKIEGYQFVIPEGGKTLYLQSYDEPVALMRDVDKIAEIDDQVPNYDNVVRSIQRIGEGTGYPIHSLDAFREAYRKGFRILLCDLIFTADDVPVCNHDTYLNEHYHNVYDANGKLVSTEEPIYFAQTTYEQLSQYSYGATGYPLLKFTDMLKLSKELGVELYVEVKGMNRAQAKIACELVQRYGMTDKTSWSGTVEEMRWVIGQIPTARVSTMPMEITDQVIAELRSLKTGKNEVFVFAYDTTVLTPEIVAQLIKYDIDFEMGTPNSAQAIIDYFNQGEAYYYCTGILTNIDIAGKVIQEYARNN